MRNNIKYTESEVDELVDVYVGTPKNNESGRDFIKRLLLKAFGPYFRKYTDLLCSKKNVDFNNPDTIKFLNLYMSKEERKTIASFRASAQYYVDLLRKTFSSYTKSDIHGELLVFFLEELRRYKPMMTTKKREKTRISFTHFIQVNLRFRIRELSRRQLKDAISGGNKNIAYCDAMEYNDFIPVVVVNNFIAAKTHSKDIDTDWVKGLTVGDTFDRLSKSERYLLWLKYESDSSGKIVSNIELGRLTGLHRYTIKYKINKIREKLKNV